MTDKKEETKPKVDEEKKEENKPVDKFFGKSSNGVFIYV